MLHINMSRLHNIIRRVSHFAVLAITALLLLCVPACKSSKKITVDEEYDRRPTRRHTPRSEEKGESAATSRLLKEARTWLGTPYGYGRSEKGEATDCSGMVVVVFRDVAGLLLPRNSAEQAAFCDSIEAGEAGEGDLVFFATGKDPNRISHVGIMLDGQTFIHSSASKGVIISDLSTPYYQRTLICFGRVPGFKK